MYDIRQLQLRILEILKDVDAALQKNNLRYYLAAGTMLGAVRHKGFIPWDDDVDIAMPREDYEIFCRRAKDILPDHLEFISMETDDSHQFPFGKVQDARTTLIERKHMGYLGGIYLDVFPIDRIECNALLRKIRLMRYEVYKRLLYFVVRDPYKHGRGPSSWAPRIIQKFFTLKGLQRKLKSIAMGFKGEGLSIDFDSGKKGVVTADCFGQPQPIVFEGVTLMGVTKPHEYLSQLYPGDYMQLPPEEKRRQHLFYYLDLEKPYREFPEKKFSVKP